MSSLKYDPFSWLIELLAYWEGRVQPAQLASIKAISRQQASKKLKDFLSENPEALHYHSREKTYRPTSKFFPRHINRDVGQYLSWVTGQGVHHDAIPANICLEPPRELWSNLVYGHQAVFLSDCSITCSPSWNFTLLTTRVNS